MADDDLSKPSKFYKYRALDTEENCKRVEQIICESKIYFPPPSSFNDPFDCHPSFSFDATKDEMEQQYIRLVKKFERKQSQAAIRKDVKAMFADPDRDPRRPVAQRKVQDAHSTYLKDQVGVLCVSTVNDDILMWSHYANSHKGICIEFDGLNKFMAHAHRIKYSKKRFPINPYHDDRMVMLDKAMLTKSDHWEYENEWRLLRYKAGPGIEEFRKENITGIILGAQIDELHKQRVRKWILARTAPIKIYQARVDRKNFQIHIDEI